ncbi:N-acetyl-gamma-glutamyl-phosphate reductase [Persephonella sp.]
MKIAIAGASGYTGIELLRILSFFEDISINQITSRKYSGKKLKEVFPFFRDSRYEDLIFQEELDVDSSDFFFLCLPHEPSVEIVKSILDKNKKVIDLSAAYRIKNPLAYQEYYRFEHKYPELLLKAVYGLPEIFRENIKNSDIVANPGCYPTASLIGLYPALKEQFIEETVIINALSGISGAGREPKQQFHYPESFGDAYAYKPTAHRHIPEMEDVIKHVSGKNINVRFTPHILPISRGMIATISYRTSLNKKQLHELYHLMYRYEPFIRFVDQPPHIKHVAGSNFCDIYIDKDERTGFAVVITAIDNLGKGASSQAVQNFNLMTGREETYNLLNISHLGILYP